MPQSRLDFISTSAAEDRKLVAMRVFVVPSAICSLVLACAPSHRGGAEAPSAPNEAGDAPADSAPGSPDSGAATGDAGSGQAPDGAASARELMPDTEPDPSRALPEVSVRTVGLHIGGGPNDDASRAPFREAVEQRFDDFLECYKQIDTPEKGGTFGVDMFIPREGGNPEVRQPRTALKGQEFRDCVKGAFSEVKFGRPPKGPTVISYSIRFEVNDPTRAE